MSKKDLFIDTKKIQKRIKTLLDLIAKGDKDTEGANKVLEKVYYALKDTPKVKLDKVNINMFPGEYGYLRAGNYIIGKNKNSFCLFKAKEIDTIPPAQKKELEKQIAKIGKEAEGVKDKDREKITLDIPFSEWKPLSKGDIAEKFYRAVKENKDLNDDVCNYLGKEKVLKADVSGLGYGDMQYILFARKSEKYQNLEISQLMSDYTFVDQDTEARLKRGADIDTLSTEEISAYKKEIDDIEYSVKKHLSMLKLIQEEPKTVERGQKMSEVTIELLSLRDRLRILSSEIEKNFTIDDQEMIDIAKSISEEKESEIGFVHKDIIAPKPNTPKANMKLGLKRVNELVDFFKTEKGERIAKDIGIELQKEVKITNYGIFSDTNIENALENLLLYAKSLNEMVEDDQANEQKNLQGNDGNFGI